MKKNASTTKEIILDKTLDSTNKEGKLNESLQNSPINNDADSSHKGQQNN